MAEFETFVLLEHMRPTNTSMFVRINKTQRQVLDKLPVWRPYLQVTFTDKEGKNRTIRYKATTDEIYQDEQIKKGILANEKFTSNEYRALEFKNNVITTNNEAAQRYLKAYPGYDKFEGRCEDVKKKEYTLYNKAGEIKTSNVTTKKRLEAGNKIFELDLKGTQDMLYRIFGTAFKPSDDVEENHALLIQHLDGSDEAIDEILKTEINADDEATILIGKLLNAEILSFDAKLGYVSKKKGEAWIDVKAISNEYPLNERKRHFAEFITSDAGKTLWNDLEKDLKKATKT